MMMLGKGGGQGEKERKRSGRKNWREMRKGGERQ